MHQVFTAARSVSAAVPEIARFDAQFITNASFGEFSYQIQRQPHGYIGVQYLYAYATFEPYWANPLWDLMDYDVTSELNSIRERLRAALHAVPEAAWSYEPLDAEALASLLRIDASWYMYMEFTLGGWVAPFRR